MKGAGAAGFGSRSRSRAQFGSRRMEAGRGHHIMSEPQGTEACHTEAMKLAAAECERRGPVLSLCQPRLGLTLLSGRQHWQLVDGTHVACHMQDADGKEDGKKDDEKD